MIEPVQEPAVKPVEKRPVSRFWSSDSTEAAMRVLDTWASVRIARLRRQLTIPKGDAIAGKAIPNLAEWIDPRSGLRIDDWASWRCDQTSKLTSPEECVFLTVETLLSGDTELILYRPILMVYFPRQGVYHHDRIRLIVPGEIPRAHQHALVDVINAIKGAR